jgi:hypothetical protein
MLYVVSKELCSEALIPVLQKLTQKWSVFGPISTWIGKERLKKKKIMGGSNVIPNVKQFFSSLNVFLVDALKHVVNVVNIIK